VALNEQKRLAITRNILRAVQGLSVGLSQVEGILQDFELPMGDVESRIFILSRLAELIRELSARTNSALRRWTQSKKLSIIILTLKMLSSMKCPDFLP
jgi:hypothetical protein